jgi:hypothetical protein
MNNISKIFKMEKKKGFIRQVANGKAYLPTPQPLIHWDSIRRKQYGRYGQGNSK